MKMAEEVRSDSGPRQWRYSEERRATLTCPVSRGRIGGEEGHDQSRVEGLRAALTGGGGRRHGLNEIWRGGRVLAPRNWLNELSRVQGCAWLFGGVLKLEEWGRGKRRGNGDDRRSLKGVATEESGVGGPTRGQVEDEGGLATSRARAGGTRLEFSPEGPHKSIQEAA
jgi:hypothetical protein